MSADQSDSLGEVPLPDPTGNTEQASPADDTHDSAVNSATKPAEPSPRTDGDQTAESAPPRAPRKAASASVDEEAGWFERGSKNAEKVSVLEKFDDLARYQAKALAPGKIVLHSVANDIADRHRELAHHCSQDGERKNIIAHLQAFLMNDRVLKALKERRPPRATSKPAVLERSSFGIHVTWSPHQDDVDMDPLHYEICWGFRFTGAWSKCMCTEPRHLISELKPATNYQVKVRGYNARGFGPYSEIATINTSKVGNLRSGAKQALKAQMAAKKPSIFSVFKTISHGYDELVNSIIRPPRGSYDLEELGAPKFRIGRRIFARSDFVVRNGRGLKLQCSHWEPTSKYRASEKMPCLIYLHGNCGCRADAVECLEETLNNGFTLLTCDLSGSGKSEGEYISLGYHETDDVRALIRHAQQRRNASDIYLWGRSMGAVTSLLVGAKFGRKVIKGMVLDSPFEDLWTLAQELVANTEIKIPSLAIGMVRPLIRNSVQKRADFNIDDLSAISVIPKCDVPALFAAGIDDAFVGSHHAENLFNAHGSQSKQFVRFPGDHNSIRPTWFRERAMRFLETGHPVLDMPYNVLSDADVAAQQKIESARQNLSCLPETDRSKAASARSRRNSGGDAVTPADTSGDVLRVSAVLDKMQNANEREYVSSVPQAIDSDDL